MGGARSKVILRLTDCDSSGSGQVKGSQADRL